MKILAIETSCDETAVAVVEVVEKTVETVFSVLGNALYSQAPLHSEYGGVYPTLAKREHQKNIVPLTTETLKEAGMYSETDGPALMHQRGLDEITEAIREEGFRDDVQAFLSSTKKPALDLIAITNGPGLEPALWTGVSFAKSVGKIWNIPVVGINHMEGHIFSALISKTNKTTYTLPTQPFPILALLISGGHTELVSMNNWFEYTLIGRTRDDAVGEAFDKVARLLDLGYPGGPKIDAYALRAQERNAKHGIMFPRPMINEDSCDFSFSGLKTAILYMIKDMKPLSEEDKENIAMEFQDAVRDVLVSKTKQALEKTNAQTLVMGGGVSANTYLQKHMKKLLVNFPDVTLRLPPSDLTGDNAIMISVAAGIRSIKKAIGNTQPLVAKGSLSLVE